MEDTSIKRLTTSEILIEKILDLIKTGDLKRGDQLSPAPKLAKKYGVGRSSVREAVRSLSAMGYIAILPGKGTFVKKDSTSGEVSARGFINALESRPLFDIMEARQAIEQQCALLAAKRGTDVQKKNMQIIIQELNSATADLVSISRIDLEAHLILAESTNNDVMYELMKLLIDKVETYADQFWATSPKSRIEGVFTITQVLSYVIKGEGDKASKSMRDHLDLVREKLSDVVLDSTHSVSS